MKQSETESLEEACQNAWDNMSDEKKADFFKALWDKPIIINIADFENKKVGES